VFSKLQVQEKVSEIQERHSKVAEIETALLTDAIMSIIAVFSRIPLRLYSAGAGNGVGDPGAAFQGRRD